jgi:hypothetical protein
MKKFFKALFYDGSPEPKPCIRRILGTMGFMASVFATFHPAIPSEEFYNLLFMSAALLGATTIDKFAGK